MARPGTIEELQSSGWQSVPVKTELRRNAIERIRAGVPLFPAVWGYEDTVLPQLENALLAGHDVIFLGERGQAKTRMIRGLVGLLDEAIPVIAGSEINDDPFTPSSRYAKDLVAQHGGATKIEWVGRQHRYGEKLATPDTSIADIIGEVDPIKVAEGRYLSDELTLHYGLVPRSNRGIFAINELPDLSERIQVGLLNVLEERDVQVRGYKIRLPLDIMLVASANPEDYTETRGRLITPLKDRFGSQIRTHYPLDAETEMRIVDQESLIEGAEGLDVDVPDHIRMIVAEFSQLARQSPHISQRSGVSVRLSVANLETIVANAIRRSLAAGEDVAVPRISDLEAIPASTAGKVEIETLEEGREDQIIDHLLRSAVLTVFRDVVDPTGLSAVVEAFVGREPVVTGEDVSVSEYAELANEIPELRAVAESIADSRESPARLAAGIELILEGLHLSKRLNKESVGARAQYRSRG